MAWTVTISNLEHGVASLSANFSDETTNFSWSSIIKVGQEQEFADRAKVELAKYLELHKDDGVLKSDLEILLNS